MKLVSEKKLAGESLLQLQRTAYIGYDSTLKKLTLDSLIFPEATVIIVFAMTCLTVVVSFKPRRKSYGEKQGWLQGMNLLTALDKCLFCLYVCQSSAVISRVLTSLTTGLAYKDQSLGW
jgi:hypothetical protein